MVLISLSKIFIIKNLLRNIEIETLKFASAI